MLGVAPLLADQPVNTLRMQPANQQTANQQAANQQSASQQRVAQQPTHPSRQPSTNRQPGVRQTSLRQASAEQPVNRPSANQPSRVRQTSSNQVVRQDVFADGDVVDGLPQPPADVPTQPIATAGHHSYATSYDPVCGTEAEVACGIDMLPEPGCGIEIGCGIGSLIDKHGTMFGRQCCDTGCDQCCGPEMIGPGMIGPGIIGSDPACGMEVLGECGCDACQSCEVDCIPLFLPMLRIHWNRFDFFGGVQGYKGPLNFANTSLTDRNGSGSFGFYQGFNHGRGLKGWCKSFDLAAQFGVRTTQSNLSGAEFTDETRNQVFVTGGLFRRVDYGLQYGLVVDYLNQDWYFNGHLTQLRGELSWRGQNNCHLGGFQFMTSLSNDSSVTTVRDQSNNVFNSNVAFESTDQYRFFYRRLLKHNGQWSAFAGWTGQDDALLGADFSLPVRPRVALAGGVTYMIPEQGDGNGGNEEEGWNLSLGLIFRPGGHNGAGRYNRPLFDVADNGTFLVDRR